MENRIVWRGGTCNYKNWNVSTLISDTHLESTMKNLKIFEMRWSNSGHSEWETFTRNEHDSYSCCFWKDYETHFPCCHTNMQNTLVIIYFSFILLKKCFFWSKFISSLLPFKIPFIPCHLYHLFFVTVSSSLTHTYTHTYIFMCDNKNYTHNLHTNTYMYVTIKFIYI